MATKPNLQATIWPTEAHNLLMAQVNRQEELEEEDVDQRVPWPTFWEMTSKRLKEDGFLKTPEECEVHFYKVDEAVLKLGAKKFNYGDAQTQWPDQIVTRNTHPELYHAPQALMITGPAATPANTPKRAVKREISYTGCSPLPALKRTRTKSPRAKSETPTPASMYSKSDKIEKSEDAADQMLLNDGSSDLLEFTPPPPSNRPEKAFSLNYLNKGHNFANSQLQKLRMDRTDLEARLLPKKNKLKEAEVALKASKADVRDCVDKIEENSKFQTTYTNMMAHFSGGNSGREKIGHEFAEKQLEELGAERGQLVADLTGKREKLNEEEKAIELQTQKVKKIECDIAEYERLQILYGEVLAKFSQ